MNGTVTHKNTTELAAGDVVRTYGLRVLITESPVPSPDGVVATVGTILNPEYLTTPEGRGLFGGIAPADGTWAIQGNALAAWTVEGR